MNFRETIQRWPAVVASVAAAAFLIAVVAIYRESRSPWRGSPAAITSAFYSDDDGKTWFIDDRWKVPPFDHNGKIACRAAIYRYDDGKRFVAYLERFSESEKKAIEAENQKHPGQNNPFLIPTEVKKPGDVTWLSPANFKTPQDRAAYEKAMTPVTPDGSTSVSPVAPSDSDASP